MIPKESILVGVHALLDAVMDKGDGQDYYRINHAPAESVSGLCALLSGWLRERGVKVGNK